MWLTGEKGKRKSPGSHQQIAGKAARHTFIDATGEERDGALFVCEDTNGTTVERFDLARVWVWWVEDLP